MYLKFFTYTDKLLSRKVLSILIYSELETPAAYESRYINVFAFIKY